MAQLARHWLYFNGASMAHDGANTVTKMLGLACHDPEKFGAVNDRLCREFPNIVIDDLIALWREAGERQLAEAEELAEFARMRRARGRQ